MRGLASRAWQRQCNDFVLNGGKIGGAYNIRGNNGMKHLYRKVHIKGGVTTDDMQYALAKSGKMSNRVRTTHLKQESKEQSRIS